MNKKENPHQGHIKMTDTEKLHKIIPIIKKLARMGKDWRIQYLPQVYKKPIAELIKILNE